MKASYDAAAKPSDVASVLKRIASIRNCAGAQSGDPNRMYNMMIPVKAVYTTDSFGPDFPSTTYTGIGFVDSRDTSFGAGEEFFSNYRESFTKSFLKLNTTKFYSRAECDSNGDCWDYTASVNLISEVKLSEKYLQYSSDTAIAYCW